MHRLWVALALSAAPAAAQVVPDWAQIAEIFSERCVVCHSGEYAPLGLRLDDYVSAIGGSENGPVLIAGSSDSPLLGRIRGAIEPRMPMDGPPFLDDVQLAVIEDWVMAGMPEGAAVTPMFEDAADRPEGEVWFGDVAPIFLQRCVKCHSDGSILGAPPEGLRLSDLSLILAGGANLVVVPGNAPHSLLWRHVAGLEEPRMPFDGPPFLSEAEVALIRDWIDGGARDDEGNVTFVTPGELRVEGILTARNAIDGGDFIVTSETRVEDGYVIGGIYELRAQVAADGSVVATRLRAR